jgi:hypothetical protein
MPLLAQSQRQHRPWDLGPLSSSGRPWDERAHDLAVRDWVALKINKGLLVLAGNPAPGAFIHKERAIDPAHHPEVDKYDQER